MFNLENFPLRFSLLERQERLQSYSRSDWVRLTRDQATNLLEHILLQDLSRYEDWPTDQLHCHQQDGQLSVLTDC